jgi:SagB-type dehydrogenase family enzyme
LSGSPSFVDTLEQASAMAGHTALRRASCLVGSWEGHDLVLENYLSGHRTAVSAYVADWLGGLGTFTPREEALRRLDGTPHAAALLQHLVSHDVLLVEGTSLEQQDRLIQESWAWDQSARHLHYHTRRTRFHSDLEAEAASVAELARQRPPPSPFKEYGGPQIPLPDRFEELKGGLWDVLLRRRTQRDFARTPISLRELAIVLLWTWGNTWTMTDPQIGSFLLKTSPSGGARHPIEVYPVVLRVDGLDPGIYHYSVRRHALTRLRAGSFEHVVEEFCANQPWVGDAAVVCILTAVLDRSMWKYREARAYRVVLLDAGHLGQTFCLVCTALGLAPFTSAAMHDELIERELGLDGVTEVPLYTAAFGRPGSHPASPGMERST